MNQIFKLVVLLFVLHQTTYANAYIWKTLKPDEPIPQDAIKLRDEGQTIVYVGRAAHYNIVLLAEVYNATYATVEYNRIKIEKQEFEVLQATENCTWTSFLFLSSIPTNVVRGGTAWNYEPTYVGRSLSNSILPIYFTNSNKDIANQALVCDEQIEWVDATPWNVPKNAVIASEYNGNVAFIGQLLGPTEFFAGQVYPSMNETWGVYENELSIVSRGYTRVLVEKPNEYMWMTSSCGLIPDYAVVDGRTENEKELRYIAKKRASSEVGFLKYSQTIGDCNNSIYLVKNVNNN